MQRCFWFADAPVLMIFETPSHYSTVQPILEELRQHSSSSASFTCVFETSGVAPDLKGASLVHDGPLSAGFSTVGQMYVALEKEWLVVEGMGSVEVDAGAKTAKIRIGPEASEILVATLALFAIDAALAATDQQMLHGAGLMSPDMEGAVLIFAPSGAGKTTTALALAFDGFKMLTDDALILQRAPHARIWGLPRPMKVHRRTVEVLPKLQNVMGQSWNSDGEQILTRKAFAGIGEIMQIAPVPIAAVFLLGQRTSAGHNIGQISKADVLLALANDNIGTSRLGVLPRHVRKMEAIAEVLNQVPAARIHVGKPLDTLGQSIRAYCRTLELPSAQMTASA